MREAHYQLITKTLNSNGTVVFDPNVRLPLWDNAEDLRQTIHTFLPLAHIVKVSDEELENLLQVFMMKMKPFNHYLQVMLL